MISTSGVISNKTRRALDSTVLEDAVQRQDTISLLQSQIRRVRKLIPELAERVYVREHNLGPGRPPCDFEDRDDIDRLISELVDDAYELSSRPRTSPRCSTEQQQDALALLALVAGQDVEPGDRPGRWRIAERTAPDRIISSRRSRVPPRPQDPALLPGRLQGVMPISALRLQCRVSRNAA